MNYVQKGKKKRFFEGWYFKHQMEDKVFVLIPGINIDRNGRKNAFIQIITNDNSYCVNYSFLECKINSDKLYVKIGSNIFSKKGIRVNINTKEICLQGTIRYGTLTPIRYPVMGVFQFIPFMECHHDIISMYHRVQGSLVQNGKSITFDNGIGYLEKDKGSSFPKSYLWLQCNRFLKEKCAIVVSVANISYLGINFKGCFCVIHYNGIEYRFATYLGVRIITCNEKEICLRQGNYLLKIQYSSGLEKKVILEQLSIKNKVLSYKLFAPSQGGMTRVIKEQHACLARYELYFGNRLIFDLKSCEASIEVVGEITHT